MGITQESLGNHMGLKTLLVHLHRGNFGRWKSPYAGRFRGSVPDSRYKSTKFRIVNFALRDVRGRQGTILCNFLFERKVAKSLRLFFEHGINRRNEVFFAASTKGAAPNRAVRVQRYNHEHKRDIPFLSCSKILITSVSEPIPLICAICVREKE